MLARALAFPTRISTFVVRIPPEQWRRWFLVAIGIVVVVSSIQHAVKAAKPSRLGTQTRSAFLRWREQLQGRDATHPAGELLGLRQGADIYRLYNFPTPPITALILYPFSMIPPICGALAWFYFKVVLTVLAILWVFRLVEEPGRPLPDWGKAVVILLSLHPILGDLSHGNVNLFVGFLVFAALECFRRRLDVAAGLAIGLAIACKVTPALFLPYFVWKRAWKAAIATGLGVVLWSFVVPGAILGFERNVSFLHGWYEGMVRPFLIEGKVTPEHANQSIPGLVNRLLTNQPSDFAWDEDDRPYGTEFHNFAELSPGQAKWVIRVFQGLFAIAIVTGCLASVRRPTDSRQGVRLAAEFSIIVLGMLLFSERTWKHHAVTLMLPYAMLLAFLIGDCGSRRRRLAIGGLLAVVAALAVLPSFLGEHWQDEAMAYGSHTAVFVLLTIAAWIVMRVHSKREEPEPAPVPQPVA